MTDIITYAVDSDGICLLTMDEAGKTMNVMGERLTVALTQCMERAVADPEVKGVILTSGKAAFMAGADLNEFNRGFDFEGCSKGEISERLQSLSKFLRKLETCGKPLACAINGTALGAGFELALTCHYRVSADDPKILLGLPESSVGLLPGAGGTQRLIRLIGVQAAGPLLFQGTMLAPAAALEAGMIHRVVPADGLLAEAKRWLLEVGDPVQPWDKKGFVFPGGTGTLDMNFRNFFAGSIVMIRANSYGNYPAPELIAATLFEGAQLPMDTALRIEAKYFTQLLLGSVSRNLIRTMFVNKGRAERLEHRPDVTPKVKYTRIAVIGAGTMGAGIAYSAARARIDVVLIDIDQAAADRGKAYAERKLACEIERGKTNREKADEILARIRPTASYAGLTDVQLAIETVFEDRKVKSEVLSKVAALLPAAAILASNTSAMPITGLSEFTTDPAKFIGLHFFSPADRMPAVEIIRGRRTDDVTLAKALDFIQALRKTPIVVNDSPGFFTTRFIGGFISESVAMVTQGVKPALVENAARMLGMPMGALSILDEIGLDVGIRGGMQQARAPGNTDTDFGIVGKLVLQHGRHGRKNGKGFFDYSENGEKRLWPGLAGLTATLAEQPDVDTVKARILYAQLAEGARCFAEGVLVDVIDGDLGATLGVGFPAYLGGPFAAIDTIGLPEVLRQCDRLAGLYGEQFKAPQLLRDMASKGETFYGPHAVAAPGARRARA
jgi:3-hydroxyacyl-CoA dehydrogenase/enoyl-CoA hydratase/3-hydroxybutyryl-CoA epimerase